MPLADFLELSSLAMTDPVSGAALVPGGEDVDVTLDNVGEFVQVVTSRWVLGVGRAEACCPSVRTRQQRECTGRVVGGPSRGLRCSQAAKLKLGEGVGRKSTRWSFEPSLPPLCYFKLFSCRCCARPNRPPSGPQTRACVLLSREIPGGCTQGFCRRPKLSARAAPRCFR